MIAALPAANEMRFKRLNDELEQDAPLDFASRTILAKAVRTSANRGPGLLYRVQTNPADPVRTYRVTRAWFETVPLIYNGLPVSEDMTPLQLAAGDEVFAKCSIAWEIATTTYDEIVSSSPDVIESRNAFYKSGPYSGLRCELLIIPAGADWPLDRIAPEWSNAQDALTAGMQQPDYHHFSLGAILADGSVAPAYRGNFLPTGVYGVASNI